MGGLTLGMVFVIALVGSGITTLLFTIPGAAQLVTILASAYFVYLAYRIATAPPLSGGDSGAKPPSWLAAIFVSLANPKAYAAMAAMFSGFTIVTSDALADAGVKFMLLMSVIVTVNIVWLLAGSALTPYFRNPATSRVLNIAFAAALLVSVVAAVLFYLLNALIQFNFSHPVRHCTPVLLCRAYLQLIGSAQTFTRRFQL